jgi:signal transduction histidine kinase
MAEHTVVTPQGDGIISGSQTAEEYRNRYGKKHFTSKTAPKAVLYSFLYECFLQGEKKPILPLYPDIVSIRDKVETYEDMDSWNGYLNLIEWQRSAFNTAVFMRNALQSNLSDLDHMARNLIAAEELRGKLKSTDLSEDSRLWLYSLTIEAYTPQSGGGIIETLRKNIEAGLRYMKAYNTFMALIAEELKAPEYTIQKVLMLRVEDALEGVNEALSLLREVTERERAEEAQGTSAGILTQWTPEYFRETMKLFEPVGENLPPIPEETVQDARRRIKEGVKKGQYSWYTAFFRFSTKYWRVDVYE